MSPLNNSTQVNCLSFIDQEVFGQCPFYISTIILNILNFIIIFGNIAVILAVLTTKKLRRVSDNYFLLSLAFSDLALGIFVLPFSTVSETLTLWIFGSSYCRLWLALDIWLCTASIYNLMAIAIDRYLAVAKPLSYKMTMNDGRKMILIVIAWTLSFFISCPAMISMWSRAFERVSKDCICTQMNYSVGYTLFSATASFYVPLLVIFSLYFKMYQIIRRVGSSNRNGFIECDGPSITIDHGASLGMSIADDEGSIMLNARNSIMFNQGDAQCLRVHKGRYNVHGSTTMNSLNLAASHPTDDPVEDNQRLSVSLGMRRRSCSWSASQASINTIPLERRKSLLQFPETLTKFTKRCEVKASKYHKRLALEVRALKTVGLVTGCFFLCWCGFCIVYTSQVFPSCRNPEAPCLPELLVSIFTWMGYANSALNPLIYAACSRQYRSAMIRLFRCGNLFRR